MTAIAETEELEAFVADVVDTSIAGDTEALLDIVRSHHLATIKDTLEAYIATLSPGAPKTALQAFVVDVVDAAIAGNAEELLDIRRPHHLATLKTALDAYAVDLVPVEPEP